MNELPKYFKAVDPDGKAIALLVVETPTRTTVIERNAAQKRVAFRTVDNIKGAFVGGQIADIEADEHDKILYDEWKFSVSDAVLNAIAEQQEEADDESHTSTEPAAATEPQSEGLSEADEATGSEGGEPAADDDSNDDAPADVEPVAEDADGVDGNVEDSDDGNADDAGTDEEAASDEPADDAVSGGEPDADDVEGDAEKSA